MGRAVTIFTGQWADLSLDKLAELAPDLDEETLAHWQKTDINRKVEGSRAKSTIWRNWTKEQRAAYKEIVG